MNEFDKPIINLNRLQVIDAKREWENSWIPNNIQTNFSTKLLNECEFNFSDFVVLTLFQHITFMRTSLSDTKKPLQYLKFIITITSKEEADYIKYGFKGNKHNSKLYKRIVRAYKGIINLKNVNRKYREVYSNVRVKDFIINILNEILKCNTDEATIIKELGEAVENKIPALFVHNYLLALYNNYDLALKTAEVYGDAVDGKLKSDIQDEFNLELSFLIKSIPSKKFNKDAIYNNLGLDALISLVDAESSQMQDDKAFYFKKFIEACEKNSKLTSTIEELTEELIFYKNLYKNKLLGKKVILIGDKKKENEYEEIISSFSGEMQMYDSFDDFSKINPSTLNEADYIVLFTYYTSHSVSNKLDNYNDKLIFVNSSSKLELEKKIVLL